MQKNQFPSTEKTLKIKRLITEKGPCSYTTIVSETGMKPDAERLAKHGVTRVAYNGFSMYCVGEKQIEEAKDILLKKDLYHHPPLPEAFLMFYLEEKPWLRDDLVERVHGLYRRPSRNLYSRGFVAAALGRLIDGGSLLEAKVTPTSTYHDNRHVVYTKEQTERVAELLLKLWKPYQKVNFDKRQVRHLSVELAEMVHSIGISQGL